ncbi:MAG: Gfo/Idh/MocA family oxidoreductase [Planctomycetales bacterium]|nr:Gfo/Idh/MocA family oxidoreductase [Planctomycetales bacterium]
MPASTRRQFLKHSAASAAFATFTISGTKSSGRVIGANDKIRVGVAGINGRGQSHIDGFASQKNVEVSYLIDPDSRLFASRSSRVRDKGGNDPACVQDVREALEDKHLNAISVATCNHWHSLISIWACQAGKDVYVEKPLSHNVFEGRQLVEAAKKYQRVVQHGTQQRSSGGRASQMAAIQSGKYGKLLVSKGYCCKPRWSIGAKPIEKPPAELDWNLWLGPAPMQDYHRNLVHYNWHWFWDTGNGDTGNQGVHEMDVARWAIRGATMPRSVWSLGGRFAYEDQGETPNTQLAVYDYGETLLVFETRGLVDKHKDFKRKVTNEYYTSEGVIRGGKFTAREGGKTYDVEVPETHVTPGGPFGAFIAAVRSRKPEDNNADAEVGHYSAALCHLANISYRLGEDVPFNKKTQSLGDNKQVVESFETIRENLQAVGVQLAETKYRLGRQLKIDVDKERFIGDDEANALLTRAYRAPFVVPEKV